MRFAVPEDEVILERFKMEDAVRFYTPGLKPERGRIACPFHNGSNKNLRIDGGFFYCYVCHASGDAISYVAKALNYNRLGAKRQICEDFGIAPDYKPPSMREIHRWQEERRKAAEEAECKRKRSVAEENKLCEYRRLVNSVYGAAADEILMRIDEVLDYHLPDKDGNEILYDYDTSLLIMMYANELNEMERRRT